MDVLEEIKELYKQNPPRDGGTCRSKIRKTFTDVNLEDDEVVSIFVLIDQLKNKFNIMGLV